MSQSQISQSQISQSQPSAFVEHLIDFLLPYFIGTGLDIDAARFEALETLGSFGARTRAEMLNAARIIAFGMSTLDALKEARAPDQSPAMQIRHRGSANALNRSTVQNEKILERRLAKAPPAPVNPLQPMAIDLTDEQVQEAVSLAQQSIQRLRAASPAHKPPVAGRPASLSQPAAMTAAPPNARIA